MFASLPGALILSYMVPTRRSSPFLDLRAEFTLCFPFKTTSRRLRFIIPSSLHQKDKINISSTESDKLLAQEYNYIIYSELVVLNKVFMYLLGPTDSWS